MQNQKVGLSGASRGTAYHKLMELLDFTRQYTKAALKNAVHDFEKEKKMTSEMAACIRISDILLFSISNLNTFYTPFINVTFNIPLGF